MESSINIQDPVTNKTVLVTQEDSYIDIVAKYSTIHLTDEYYIHVGEPSVSQGWIVHITSIASEMRSLLEKVLPVLSDFAAPYKIIKDKKQLANLNSGDYGTYKIGKAITIFLDNENIIEPLTKQMLLLTSGFSGPQVFSDFFLGNNVFTRYGSFISRIETDTMGNLVRVISDAEGTLILDLYHTPPIIPKGISNPFLSFITPQPEKKNSFLIANKYMPLRTLKSDVKGDVWTALYFTKYLLPKICVIKQARKGLFLDEQGRDSQDRLKWQFEVDRVFQKQLSSPPVIEYLHHENETYLSMRYVKGTDLKTVIQEKLKGLAWCTQPSKIRSEVLDYFLQILFDIRKIHQAHYIHRDITANNFLVTRNGKVHMIDTELFYSIDTDSPAPPFGVGTPGYMSPQQEQELPPSYADDVYSLGALLVIIFTSGLSARFFVEPDRARLLKKLEFFTRDKIVAQLIADCLAQDPLDRPSLDEIEQIIFNYIKRASESASNDLPNPVPSPRNIENTIERYIYTLSGSQMAEKGSWFSPVENDYGRDIYPLGDKHIFTRLYRGMAGTIWLMCQLQRTGININRLRSRIHRGVEHICSEIESRGEFMSRSLYYGKAGLGLTLARSIKAGLIPDQDRYRELISYCLQEPTDRYDLIFGLSGQALGMMQCLDFLPNGKENLALYAEACIQGQQKDGSWILTSDDQLGEKSTGFGYGIAGVIYFLLQYASSHNDPAALGSAIRGLRYLENVAEKKKGFLAWRNSDKDKGYNTWWCKGSPGIALSFLKGYEMTKEASFLDTATRALHMHEPYPVYQQLNQCHGISGLGEIYLEAYKTTGDPAWQDRATWIANLLLNFAKQPDEKSVFWLADNNNFPTADFMTGNSGVIHFLARYIHPDKMSFPIIA